MSKVELKTKRISVDIFNYILTEFSTKIKFSDKIHQEFCGSKYSGHSKRYIYTDNCKYLVCTEDILNYASLQVCGVQCIYGATTWKQVRCIKDEDTNGTKSEYNGSYCYNYIMKIVKRYYTNEEIEEIYHSHSRDYDEGYKQYHYMTELEYDKIVKYDDCYFYDINGAHSYMLMELFPKARKDLLKLYSRKNYYKKIGDKENYDKIKSLFNYCVGELCNKKDSNGNYFRGTYNYIVQETTKRAFNTMDILGGTVLYANTDSILVHKPDRKLEVSDDLGGFKLEGEGRFYFYRDKNYRIFEYKDTNNEYNQKGNCPKSLKHFIELRNNLVVHYDVERVFIGYDEKGKRRYTEKLHNIKQEKKQ